MQNKKIIASVVVCLAIASLSFWGGMKYGQTKNSSPSFSNRQGSFNQNGFNQNTNSKMGQGMRNGTGGGFTSGEIISKDDKSMTIKLRDGGSKIIFFTDSTKVEKTVDGVTSDISVGKQVMITGTTNPDGSVSATSVQMRPEIQIQPKSN